MIVHPSCAFPSEEHIPVSFYHILVVNFRADDARHSQYLLVDGIPLKIGIHCSRSSAPVCDRSVFRSSADLHGTPMYSKRENREGHDWVRARVRARFCAPRSFSDRLRGHRRAGFHAVRKIGDCLHRSIHPEPGGFRFVGGWTCPSVPTTPGRCFGDGTIFDSRNRTRRLRPRG